MRLGYLFFNCLSFFLYSIPTFRDTKESILELSELGLDPVRVDYADLDNPVLKIETLEGLMVATEGDYIIKGVQGEFYPCKPDIFKETYEKVEE